MLFFIEVLVGGLLAGVMYSLVALGFVLIYKASGVLNFAQGSLVLFAALTFVGLMEKGLPFWAALIAAFIIMIIVGVLTERIVLRPLVNQPPITLFMATIGLSILIEGIGQLIWGAQVRGLDLGINDIPREFFGVLISQFDLFAAGCAAILVIVLSLVFNYTRIGRALRAVADDHQAAMSVGIPLKDVWAVVWAAAGFVALVAGLLWGSRLGVQFALTLVVLKALPVLLIGGFTSIPGAIVGGLIVGAGEKLAEVYIGPFFGGGIENWFPYVLGLIFLLIRPDGLFGEKHIQRV
ncbi:MAG: High-affinity branched-chain amino acid transport system permease protein LivH [Rhodocyclaceae bacterium]|nr:branched-chain amino acid ABC transporter permease [Rhodocyclaceae bacterium]MCG3186042.1 High-affinity branched-chain amino acid transport system permease protein LivH [Rhodocyclaceae bacterium]HMM72784.1 branched-chain amino acid ABC transporter permease [Rhodocyclaceae bacterium]